MAVPAQKICPAGLDSRHMAPALENLMRPLRALGAQVKEGLSGLV